MTKIAFLMTDPADEDLTFVFSVLVGTKPLFAFVRAPDKAVALADVVADDEIWLRDTVIYHGIFPGEMLDTTAK